MLGRGPDILRFSTIARLTLTDRRFYEIGLHNRIHQVHLPASSLLPLQGPWEFFAFLRAAHSQKDRKHGQSREASQRSVDALLTADMAGSNSSLGESIVSVPTAAPGPPEDDGERSDMVVGADAVSGSELWITNSVCGVDSTASAASAYFSRSSPPHRAPLQRAWTTKVSRAGSRPQSRMSVRSVGPSSPRPLKEDMKLVGRKLRSHRQRINRARFSQSRQDMELDGDSQIKDKIGVADNNSREAAGGSGGGLASTLQGYGRTQNSALPSHVHLPNSAQYMLEIVHQMDPDAQRRGGMGHHPQRGRSFSTVSAAGAALSSIPRSVSRQQRAMNQLRQKKTPKFVQRLETAVEMDTAISRGQAQSQVPKQTADFHTPNGAQRSVAHAPQSAPAHTKSTNRTGVELDVTVAPATKTADTAAVKSDASWMSPKGLVLTLSRIVPKGLSVFSGSGGPGTATVNVQPDPAAWM